MNFKTFLPHILAVVFFAVISTFYFHPQFTGGTLRGGDLVSHRGMSGEASKFAKETGEAQLWTNGMFGGMPTYQINRISEGNLLRYVQESISFWIANPFGVFFAGMLSFYLMALLMGVNHWLAIVGSMAFGLATNDFILWDAGHANKVLAIAYFPLIVSGVILAFRKNYLAGGIIFGLGMGINLLLNHPQMTLYLAMTMLIYGVGQAIVIARKGEWVHLGKVAAALSVGLLLGMGSAASNVLPTLEYSSSTMRGKPILTPPASGETVSSSQTNGLAWDYAMQWSNDYKDLLATFIPNAAGSGPATEISPDSPFGDAVRKIGARPPAKISLPLYHGGLTFTAGPIYLGALLWFLFLFGALTVRGPLKWWLVGGVLLTMMLSMGKNLEWFNRIIFDYFPLYNKFRTPNSVLSITDFLMAILAILGLHRSYVAMQEAKGEELRMPLFIAAGVTGGLALLYWLVGPSLMDFSGPRDASYAAQFLGQNAQQAQVATLVTGFEETRAQLLRQDALRSLLFIALGFATLFVYLRKTISLPIMAGVLTLLIVVDFGGVTSRYYSTDNFSTKRKEDAFFEPSPADQQILADTDPNFRVFNQTVSDPFQDASTSYLHKSVGGYHAAKLQRYDDIISRHLRRGNQAVFDMLNTKYFIQQGQDGQPAAARNPGALGNAWLVNNIQVVNSADEEIDALSEGFNPGTTAVVHQEFSDRISGVAPTGEGMITLTSYLPSKLTYTFNSSAQQFAVFSEIWYGPDKGWTATIDGEEVDVLRANYLLRALVVPAGQHEIVFTFKPATYASGVIISYISSILLLAGLAFLGYRMYQSYESAPAAPQQPVPVKQPAAVPARKKPKKKK